jgi:hypothetical protein
MAERLAEDQMFSLTPTVREDVKGPTRVINFKIGETWVGLTWENTQIFTFVGEWATHNHAFITLPPESSESSNPDAPVAGHYLFCHDPDYQAIADFAYVHNFRQVLNMPEPEPGDIEAYNAAPKPEELDFGSFLTGEFGYSEEDPTDEGLTDPSA